MTSPSSPRPAGPSVQALFETAVRKHLSGDLDSALTAYDALIAQAPDAAEPHNNAGAIRGGMGDHVGAIAHFHRAIAIQPGYADAHHNLGLVLCRLRRYADAIGPLQRAVEIAADRAAWWFDLGNALLEIQRGAEAIASYDRAIELAPNDAPSHANRAIALRGQRRYREAIEACGRALALDPTFVDALNNLGIIQKEVRNFRDASAAFARALAIAPNSATVRVNLAVLLMEMNRHDSAQALAEAVLRDEPGNVDAMSVLANCAFEAADWPLAESYHTRALALVPDDRNALWNRAILTLLSGDLREGFRQFESRKKLQSVVFTHRHFAQPEWDGAPLDGRTILVHAEQGVGDVLQFARYAGVLKARGAGRVLLEAPDEVSMLLRTVPELDAVVVEGGLRPPFDVHAYLMSLPYLCGTTLETIPATVPYLRAPERAVTRRIRESAGVRVGVVWAGNPMHQRDAIRSVALETLLPILEVPGVTFFSLQKGAAVAELSDPRFAHVVDLDPVLHDYADTAAALSALDVVISVDTSVVHLAGALNKPTWMLLPAVPDWRWLLDREDSPWYPSLRIFRQRTRGEWSDPVRAVEASLRLVAAADGSRGASAVIDDVEGPEARERPVVEIGWPVGLTSGWGTYGLQLALALARSDRVEPVLGAGADGNGVSPLAARALRGLRTGIPSSRAADAIQLRALGNGFVGAEERGTVRAGRRAGVIFFEDTVLDDAALARAATFDTIIAGSSWNAEILKASGVENVRLVLQGIDPALFHPAPRSGTLGGRFLIFSGGKLEFRKGQDIVVEAFRRFHATHPDAMLVTAWHNHWPQTMADIGRAGHVRGAPAVRDGVCEIVPWLVSNGISADAVLDLGQQSQAAMAQVLHEMDVAVFPNRCEGGTNLVAMEAMACGVPTILSANTGHLNLIGVDTCYPLERQTDIHLSLPSYRGTAFWGESDPDEIVAALEAVYDDRESALARGLNGARLMAQLPWSAQAEELLRQLEI